MSIATVSRVVNGSARVSPRTRSAVESAVAKLGYVPNRAARSLVTRRTDTLALVLSEPESRLFSDPFFGAIVRGAVAAVSDTELQLVLLLAPNHEHAKVERYVRQGHVDGVMLMCLHGDDPLPERLIAAGVPTVLTGRPQPGQTLPYVDADNRAGAREAAAFLTSSGRRTISAIHGPLDMTVAVDRFEGYRDALAAAGLGFRPELAADGDFSVAGGEAAMEVLLEREPAIDAVVAASDPMAAGAILALRASGRRIPDDVAVVGFDDAPIAGSTLPPLTTMRQPLEDMARSLVGLLQGRIAGTVSVDEHVIFETTLVRRGSA